MARVFTAYLRRSAVPAQEALQRSLDALKFKLVIDDGYVPFETAGYLPCTLDGEDAGFDLRFVELAADAPASADVLAQLEGRDIAMPMRWGGDPREKASVLMVCAALAKDFGAIVLDGERDRLASVPALTEAAREAAES